MQVIEKNNLFTQISVEESGVAAGGATVYFNQSIYNFIVGTAIDKLFPVDPPTLLQLTEIREYAAQKSIFASPFNDVNPKYFPLDR